MEQRDNPEKLKRILKRILLLLIILATVLSVAVVFVWSKLDLIQYENEIDYEIYRSQTETEGVETKPAEIVSLEGLEQVETAPPIPESEVFQDDDVFNILLIGTDERTTEFHYNARSDSMILVSIHRGNNTVRLISLERGIGVPILDGEYEGQYDLLTHIFRWGGADLLVRTVEHCFKVDVDHYVRLNFQSVEKVIDAVGGINMELTLAEAGYLGNFYYDLNSPYGTKALHTGMNRMNGASALAYARLREIDSDWQRVARQRKVIIAVVEELRGASLLELNALADTVLPLVQTNLTKIQIAELVLYAPNFLNASFDQMTIPKQGTYGGMMIRNSAGAFAVDFEINNAIIHDFLYEGKSSEELLK